MKKKTELVNHVQQRNIRIKKERKMENANKESQNDQTAYETRYEKR